VLAALGDVDTPVFPRSAVKPLQALPLAAIAAASPDRATGQQLAIATGSHGGEPAHVAVVASWLARIGLCETKLVCGSHWPLAESAAQTLVREGREPSPLHNNCSGKHTGFLSLAQALDEPPERYADPDSRVQRMVRRALSAMAGTDLERLPQAIDGCGVPVVAMPLRHLATAFARLAAPSGLAAEPARAAERVAAAMAAYPHMVAGSGRFDTAVITATAGAVLVKGGAEGVAAAAVRQRGIGVALKIDDGARRAAETAMAALLLAIDALDDAAGMLLAGYAEAPVTNTQGRTVGLIRPVPGWLETIPHR
jgi:L-asparaginase II